MLILPFDNNGTTGGSSPAGNEARLIKIYLRIFADT